MSCRTAERRINRGDNLLETDRGPSFTQSEVEGMIENYSNQLVGKLKTKYKEIVEISADKELEQKASKILHRKLQDAERKAEEAIKKAQEAEEKLFAYQEQVRHSQKDIKSIADINNFIMNDKKFKDDVSKRMKDKEAEVMAKYGL